jgi:hypothetical protein
MISNFLMSLYLNKAYIWRILCFSKRLLLPVTRRDTVSKEAVDLLDTAPCDFANAKVYIRQRDET